LIGKATKIIPFSFLLLLWV